MSVSRPGDADALPCCQWQPKASTAAPRHPQASTNHRFPFPALIELELYPKAFGESRACAPDGSVDDFFDQFRVDLFGALLETEIVALRIDVDPDRVALGEVAAEDPAGERVLDPLLDYPL